MHVLLVNNNPVVSRLVAIAAKNRGIALEEVSHVSQVTRFHYQAVIVDDMSYDDEERALLDALHTPKRFLLSSTTSETTDKMFDAVLLKPFLPSQVEKLLETIETQSQTVDAVEEQDEFYFMIDEEGDQKGDESGVLDEEEVARIKALLEESEGIDDHEIPTDETAMEERKVQAITENLQKEGLEIVDEATMIESLTETEAKTPALTMDGDTFLEMLATMKTKKLKKLLKGAKVTLTVEFGED